MKHVRVFVLFPLLSSRIVFSDDGGCASPPRGRSASSCNYIFPRTFNKTSSIFVTDHIYKAKHNIQQYNRRGLVCGACDMAATAAERRRMSSPIPGPTFTDTTARIFFIFSIDPRWTGMAHVFVYSNIGGIRFGG